MVYLRYTLIFIGLLLFSWHVYAYASIDENLIKNTVSGGVPTRFIQADEQTLEALKERLNELEPLSRRVTDAPQQRTFGRSTLFLPDGQ